MKVFKIRIEGDDNPNWHRDIIGKAKTINEATEKAIAYASKCAEANFTEGPRVTIAEELGELVF